MSTALIINMLRLLSFFFVLLHKPLRRIEQFHQNIMKLGKKEQRLGLGVLSPKYWKQGSQQNLLAHISGKISTNLMISNRM